MPKMQQKQNCLEKLAILEKAGPILRSEHVWPTYRRTLRRYIKKYNCNFGLFYHWPVMHEVFITFGTSLGLPSYDALDDKHLEVAKDPILGGIDTVRAPLLPNGGTVTYARQALACQLLTSWLAREPESWGDIFEFGGGFGALACVLQRLGYAGRHTIYDFPECSIIQEWYHNELALSNIEYLNDIGPSPAEYDFDIFMSLCAIEEASVATREAILNSVTASAYFIWYTAHYAINPGEPSIDNRMWFSRYFKALGYEITIIDAPYTNQEIMLAEA